MAERILITGGAGFIGHHVVQYFLETTNYELVLMDRLDLSGNLNRLAEVIKPEHKSKLKFVWHDLKSPVNEYVAKSIGHVDYIFHLAASTHVDRSISYPMEFVLDNVVGTANLLDFARLAQPKLFINFSTDEVFGPAPLGYSYKETDPHNPSNPYSATKSAAHYIGLSYFHTYKLPIITTYTMNNFGERQHPEKLIPKCIQSVIQGKEMPIFAEIDEKGETKAVGSRFWLHSRNVASALKFLMEKGVPGESYNIVGFVELTNLELCEKIAKIIGKPLLPKFVDFHKTRPGHDRRYALDGGKLAGMGWKPEVEFDESLKRTVEFTMNNPQWQ